MQYKNSPSQPRLKEPNQIQLRNLKTEIQKLDLPPRHFIYYNLSTKQSKTGFFNNDRLLILNTKQKYLGYVSKLPEYKLPFREELQVNTLKFKCKIRRQDIVEGRIKQFKCQPVTGKIGTFEVCYTMGNREEVQQWVMEMKVVKLMHRWVEIINQALLKDQVIEPEPEKVNQPMPTIIEQPPQPQQYEPKSRFQSHKILNEDRNYYNPVLPVFYNQSENNQKQSIYYQQTSRQPSQDLKPAVENNISNIDNSIIKMSNFSQVQPEPPSSHIANLPYNDHVTELQYLRKNKPQKFNTSNQLSHKKLPPLEQMRENNQNNLNYEEVANMNKYGKDVYYKDNSNEPYAVRRESNSFQERYEGREYSRAREDSKKDLTNSYLVNQPVKFSRSSSPLPHQVPARSQNNLEYKPYNSSEDNPIELEPQITVSRPSNQFIRTGSRGQMSNVSSKANIVIDNKSRSIANVVIQEEPEYMRPDIPLSKSKTNFLNKDSKSQQSNRSYGSRRGLSRRKWNQIFAETSSKLQIYEQFVQTSYNIVRDIVNELALDSNRKDYLPIEVKSPYQTYYNEGIILTMHRFDSRQSITSPTSVQNAPLLFDQSEYQLLKRQFYNYNLLLSVTANQGFIKVPLCAYFEYKGILAICKAQIPQHFNEVTPKRYEQQFQILEEQIHLRFLFGSFNSYLHPNGKYIVLDNMRQLVPELPVNNKEGTFFRKQFLLGYEKVIEDSDGVHEAHDVLLNQNVPELLGKLQSLEIYIVNQQDMLREFHEIGLSYAYLPHLIQTTTSPFIKKVLLTQLVSIVFTSIYRSQIHSLHSSFSRQFHRFTLQEINQRLLQSTHVLMDMLFSYNNHSDHLWKIIVEQCKIKYRIIVSKEDLIPGYLLSSVVERMGVNCSFRQSTFDKHQIQFFAKEGNLPKDILTGFKVRVRRYDLGSISALVQNVQQIIHSMPTPQNFKTLVSQLNLKQQPLPNYLQPFQQQILTYLCHFVPYSQHQQFQHIGIYNMVLLQPHSQCSNKCSLLAIKWCIKKKYIEEALKIYQMKELENAFWQGEYNPAISELYDFFSMYYASVGQYDHSIQLAKMSLKNIMKVSGATALPVADKHYQLGNIYFKMGKKEESLKEYTRTKDILKTHNQTQISQYAVILLKLSVLYLNFGKVFEAVNHSLEALKIYDATQSNQEDQIGTFQILSRCYQITKKQDQLQQISDLASEKFNQTEDYLIFTRMIKMILYVKLKKLSSPQAKALTAITNKLQEHCSNYNQLQAFSFLNRKCQTELLSRKLQNYLQNIGLLYEEASRRDLFRRYKSLDPDTRNQVQQMLVMLQAIGMMVGFGFILGSLKQTYD